MTLAARCKICGTVFWGIDQVEVDRWSANHILGEHGEQAPDRFLEEARERLEELRGGVNDEP